MSRIKRVFKNKGIKFVSREKFSVIKSGERIYNYGFAFFWERGKKYPSTAVELQAKKGDFVECIYWDGDFVTHLLERV